MHTDNVFSATPNSLHQHQHLFPTLHKHRSEFECKWKQNHQMTVVKVSLYQTYSETALKLSKLVEQEGGHACQDLESSCCHSDAYACVAFRNSVLQNALLLLLARETCQM